MEIEEEEPLTLLQILGPQSSTCGYCLPSGSGQRLRTKSSKSYGVWAHQLSCEKYKKLIDRGWRRSGAYLYKPDMGATCCAQYTIRLNASEYKPSKSQRNTLNRFNSLVKLGGAVPSTGPSSKTSIKQMDLAGVGGNTEARINVKGKDNANAGKFDLQAVVHAVEYDNAPKAAHHCEISLEPAIFTQEKYDLYKLYQIAVHGDKESKLTEKGFTRFLCNSPLALERSPCISQPYGSFHHLYRMDGRLIAIGVLDILPGAVSSVYLIYHPDYSHLSLGKVSAMRECALAQELGQKFGRQMYYMMGFYIHTCSKMRYKAEYSPSELLDPETYGWWTFEPTCRARLDQNSHAIFSQAPSSDTASNRTVGHPVPTANTDAAMASDSGDEGESDEGDLRRPVPPGFLDPTNLPRALLVKVYVLERGQAVPYFLSGSFKSLATDRKLREGIAALGEAATGVCVFYDSA